MSFCRVEECLREAKGGELCAAHRKQLQRTGQTKTVVERPASPLERVREAAITYADRTDGFDEAAFARADENLRKASVAYGVRKFLDAMKEGRERARAAGVRFGRPPKLTREVADELVREAGSIKRAAAMAGVHRRTIRRART